MKEAGNSAGESSPIRKGVWKAGPRWNCRPRLLSLQATPELIENAKAVFARVADDHGCVDRADRGAYDPVGFDARFVQRLIDADLESSQSPATLKHQHDL